MDKTEPMQTLTISLPPEQADRVQAAVDAGSYLSSSDVVSEALRLWEQREQIRASEVQRLKAAYERGMASGEPVEVDLDAMLTDLKAKRAGRV